MLGDEPGRLTCPRAEGLACPSTPCPGRSSPEVCSHLASLSTWRSMSTDEQIGRLGRPRPTIDPAVRDAVNACPDRGPVLPISLQDDCGCRGKELSECRAGQGAIPGRVTLRDCLTCKGKLGEFKM
jgi:hypothetical protein